MFTLVNGPCPLTAVEWRNLETAYCKDGGKYHCIPNENGQLGQVCTQAIWIQPNACPVFNTKSQTMGARLCDSRQPECQIFHDYRSNKAYQYLECYPEEEMRTTEQFTTTEAISKSISYVSTLLQIVIPVLVIAVLVAAVLVGVFIYRKKNRRRNGNSANDGLDEEQQTEEERVRLMVPDPCLEIQRHREDTTFYSDTSVAATGLKVLSNYGVLIVVGLPGSGKTRLGLEMGSSCLGQLLNGHYCKFRLARDLENMEHEIESDYHTCFFLDDCFETWNYTQQENTSTKNAELDHLTAFYENYVKKQSYVSIIVTVSLTTWKRFYGVFKASSIFAPEHVISIRYDAIDKKEIFRGHAKASGLIIADKSECLLPEYTNVTAVCEYVTRENVGNQKQTGNEDANIASIPEKDVKEILRAESKALGFPEACALFCHDAVLWQKGSKFFEKPMQYLKGRFEGMLGSGETRGKARICTLFYTLLNEGVLVVSNCNKKLLNEIGKLFELDFRNEDLIAKSVEYLSGSYLTKVFHGNFVFQHDVIEFVVLSLLYEKNAEILLRHCPARALQRYVRASTYQKKQSEMVMKITLQHTESLAMRLADEGLSDD